MSLYELIANVIEEHVTNRFDNDANSFNKTTTEKLVEEICLKLELTERQLSRIIAVSSNRTILQFIHEIKLKVAGQFLIERKGNKFVYPIKTIAFRIGYNHVSDFTSAFKKHHNQTPKVYRDAQTTQS